MVRKLRQRKDKKKADQQKIFGRFDRVEASMLGCGALVLLVLAALWLMSRLK